MSTVDRRRFDAAAFELFQARPAMYVTGHPWMHERAPQHPGRTPAPDNVVSAVWLEPWEDLSDEMDAQIDFESQSIATAASERALSLRALMRLVGGAAIAVCALAVACLLATGH